MTSLIAQPAVRLIRSLNTLLNHLPELIHVYSSGYPYATFARRQDVGNRPAGLLLATLRLFSRALGDDCHVEALVVLGALALDVIPVVEDDFVRSTGEDGSEGEGIVEGRAGSDAKNVTIWFVSCYSPRQTSLKSKGETLRISLGKEVKQLNQHRPQRRLASASLLAVLAVQQKLSDLLRSQDLVAQVQRDHEHLLGNLFVVEYLGRRLRVNEDVELGIWCCVANALLAINRTQRCV